MAQRHDGGVQAQASVASAIPPAAPAHSHQPAAFPGITPAVVAQGIPYRVVTDAPITQFIKKLPRDFSHKAAFQIMEKDKLMLYHNIRSKHRL